MRLGDALQRRLAITIEPASNESLLGFLTRVADQNVLQRPADILEGLCAWPPDKLTEPQQASIARIIGIQPRELRAVYKRSFLRELPRAMLNYERRRVAPASLLVSPHHRASWLIKAIDFCVESWQVLIENCPSCRAPLSWGQTSVLRCHSCNRDLRTAESADVPNKWRSVLKKAVRLATADPDYDRSHVPLHPDLGLINSPQVFQLAVACGRALMPPATSQKGSEDQGWNYQNLAAGMELVLGYPASVRALAEVTSNTRKPRFFRHLANAAEARDGDLRKVMTAISAMGPEVHGIVRLKKIREENNLLTTTQLARALGVENARIRAMSDAGVFGRRDARGTARKYDWFSDHDLALGREFLDGRTYASTWAKQVDLSLMDVRQLVAAGLLKACSGRTVDRVFAGNFQIQTRSRRELEKALLSCIRFSSTYDEWVPIDWAFASIGGGYKPWAAVLTAALAGSLPYGLEYPGPYELKLGRLRVHESVALDIRRRALSQHLDMYRVTGESMGPLRPQTLSRTEAERLLNCLPADISGLCDRRLLKVVDRNPTTFDARAVEAFASAHISVQELSALLGFKSVDLAHYLPPKGFLRTKSGFWKRKDLWGPKGIVARYRRWNGPAFSAWEIPGPPKSVSFWPGVGSPTGGRAAGLFSRKQPDHP